MRPLILFVFSAIFTRNMYAQNTMTVDPSVDFHHWQFGINFSPDYCFRALKNNDGSASSNVVIRSREESEIPRLGYTTGINGRLNFNKNIGLGAGIQFSDKGYQTSELPVYFAQPGPTPARTARLVYHYYYIDIPITVNFTFGEKRLRFITAAGITTNIFIKETQTSFFEYSDGKTEKRTQRTHFNYETVNISPTISAGVDYRINQKMNLLVEPTLRYGILKIINAPVTGYLYNVGLNMGCFIGL